MPQKIWDVILIGEFFIDEILSGFHALPKLGEESFARRFMREVGGGAAITACGLAKLGAKVAVIGILGKSDGDWVVKRLNSFGVNTDALERHPNEPTGLTVSVSTREDRAFFSYYGANERLPQLLRKPATKALMAQSRFVHFACAPDSEMDSSIFTALRAKGCKISIDVQSHYSWLTRPENLNLVRQCDLFFPNEREGQWFTGQTETTRILHWLRDKKVPCVALKLGGDGAALLWRKVEYLSDAYPVESLDTTGAGDSFNAGFLYGMLRGESPQRCLETAVICGGLSTRKLGGVAAFPALQELEECQSEWQGRSAL